MEKHIELCQMRAGDLKTGFGNPRKISAKKMKELEASLDTYGDFGIFLIDEEDNVIGGNQRLKAILHLRGPDVMLDCKRLCGYTKSELKAINIKDNTHAGVWDLDLLADWTADISVDLGVDPKVVDPDERKIKDMELIRYEKYDYVMIVCDNEVDYGELTRALGIDSAKCLIAKTRRIRCRAVWFKDMRAQIVPKKELKIKEEATE